MAFTPMDIALAADPVSETIEITKDGAYKKEEVKGLPQLDFSTYPSQLFWLFVMFSLLYFIFAKKTLPEISSTIETRREQVDGDFETAQSLKEQAEKVQAEYEAALADAHQQSVELYKKSEESIKKKTNKKLADFKDKSEAAITETEALVDKAKDDAIADMHTIAAEVASAAAEKIVGVSTDLKSAKTVVKNIDRKAA